MNIQRYSKLIAAVIGVVVIIIGPDMLGLTDTTALITETAIAVLTAIGVYQVPNAP